MDDDVTDACVLCTVGAAERAIDATRDAMMMMNFLMMGCLVICGWVTYFLCAACDEKDNKNNSLCLI